MASIRLAILYLTATCFPALLLAESPRRFVYPLTPGPGRNAPPIHLDLTDVPDDGSVKEWAREAKQVCEDWYPLIYRFLAMEGWKQPEEIEIKFKRVQDLPGVTFGDSIHISVPWIKDHPDEFGLVIHELVPVMQRYPDVNRPDWLVEGIADYIRWWRYEPEAPRSEIGPNASYRDSYRTTAAFLAWIVASHDKRIVRRLDRSLREGKYRDAVFEEVTGKPLDRLWFKFVEQHKNR